jgi:hypothetical protein
MLAAGDGDGLESGVHAEGAQDVPNMVANRLDAQVELPRAAEFSQRMIPVRSMT